MRLEVSPVAGFVLHAKDDLRRPTAGCCGSNSRLVVTGVLVGFLLLAFAFAVAVSRALQGQIERFLEAARRLGGGDFSTAVPTEGRDEFAALGGDLPRAFLGCLPPRPGDAAPFRGCLRG